MKQNLQPPATPLEMLSLFFPAGLLDYFDLVNHVSQETCFIFFFFLEEKPSIPPKSIPIYIYIPKVSSGNRSARLSCSRQGCISTHQAASLGRPGNRTNL